MTIRSNYNSQTLDEYLQSVKRRVETGNSPPSGIYLELCHFARLYRQHAEHPPAEPGASRNQSSLSLQLIDEIRAEIARISADSPEGRNIRNSVLAKLEQFSVKF